MADDLSDFQPVAAAAPTHDVSDFEPVSSPASARSSISTSDLSDFEPVAPSKTNTRKFDTQLSGSDGFDLNPTLESQLSPEAKKRSDEARASENKVPSLKEAAMTPTFHPVPSMTPQEAGKWARLTDVSGIFHLLPENTANRIAGIGENVVADTANFFTSPLGIATAGIGALPRIAQTAISTAFLANALKETPDKAQAIINAKTPEERDKAIRDGIETATIIGGAGAHILSRARLASGHFSTAGASQEMLDNAVKPAPEKPTDTSALSKEVEPVLSKLPGDTQDRVRAIIAKQAAGTELSADERATLIQVQSFAATTARDQTAEQFTSPTASLPTSVSAVEAAAGKPSGIQGGSPPARSNLFAQAKQEAAVAPLVQSAEAASNVTPAAAEAAKQAAAVIAGKTSSPTAEVEPPATTGQAGAPTEAAKGQPSKMVTPSEEVPTATGAAGVEPTPEAKPLPTEPEQLLGEADDLINRLPEGATTGDYRTDFHISTKIAHTLTDWVKALRKDPSGKNQAAFSLWQDALRDYVASLPERNVRDANTGTVVDPFAGLKEKFGGGQKGDPSAAVERMHEIAKGVTGATGQDYANLVELLHGIGTETPESRAALDRLNKSTYGSTEPTAKVVDDLELETEGEKMLQPSPLAGPALIQDGQIVAKGEIGKVHDDLVREGVKQDKDLTDATRGFHDENGQPLSRTEAAQRALDTGVIDQATFDRVMKREPAENKGLHSEDLIAAKEEKAAPKTDTRKFKPEAIPDVLKELEEEKPAAPVEPVKTEKPAPIDKDEAAKATRGIPGALGDAVRDVLLNDKSVEEAAADNGTTPAKVQDSVNRMRQYLSDKAAKAAAELPKEETTETPAEPATPKEPWQRTRDEAKAANETAKHRLAVRTAVSEGKPVPLEVLEDFKGSPWADKAREQMYGQQISDTLLGKILKGLTDEGNTLYSDPLFINAVGKPVLRAAVKILQEGIESGKLAGDAITDALGYLREHIPNLNEDKANEFFDQFFEKPEEAPPTAAAEPVSPEGQAPENALPGDRAAAGETAPSPTPVDPRATTEEGQRYTSNKNAAVDAERKARGEPELMSEAAKSLGATWDEASRQVDLNREAGPNLVKELNGKPRTIGAVEEAILLHHKIDVMNDLSKNTEVALDANADAGDRAEARMTAARLMDQLNDIDEATRKAGTEWGRTGRFRQVLALEDYSLAKMLQRSELAKGRPLTEEEQVKIQQMSTRIADLEKKLAEHEQQADARREQTKNADVDKAIAEMKKPATEADKYAQGILERIQSGLKSEADKARTRIRARLGKASAGVDPTVLYDVAVIGAEKLFSTGLDFARWSSELAKDLGDTFAETLKPHLEDLFQQSQKINDEAIEKGAPKELRAKLKTKPKDDAEARMQIVQTIANRSKAKESLGGQIKKLALNFVNNGITDREALVTAVHDAVKEALPEATRRDIRDSISGHGVYRELDMDATKVVLRDLQGQMQQISKIEDLTGKGPTGKPKLPDPTGAQRRTKSAEERVLEQEVNRIKKESGLEQTDPRSLKGAMDAVKARLKNRIEDLQLAISKKEKLPAKGKALADDPETAQLRRDKDALQKEYDAMLGVDTPGKESAKESALTKSIDDLKKQIETGETEKAKEATADTQRVAELKAQRDELLQKKEEIRRAKNPPKTEDERKVDALEKRAVELRKKIDAGDIEPKTGKATVDTTEVAAAKAEVEKLNDQIVEMRKAAHPPKSEEARRLELLEKRVKEAKAKIAAGDLAGKPKRATVDTQEITQAKSELAALNEQLSEMRKAANPPRTPEQIRERALDKRIEDLEKKIAVGDISTKTGKPTVDTAEIAARKAKLEALNKELADLREAVNPKPTPDQIALKVYKTRTAKRIADLQDRLARKDFSTKPRKLVPLDTEGFKLKTDAERAKLEFDREKYKDEQATRKPWEKFIDYVPKVSRAVLLSSPLTLAKLTAAALWRMSVTPMEELIASGLNKLPFVSDVAARAPREGSGFNGTAEAKALTDAVTLGMKDAYQKLFRGDTDLDVTGQKRSIIPHELIDFFGNIHGALKAPVVRAEFARSFEKRAQFAIANGIDVTDPMVLTRLQVESYKDAQRAIFMQDNRVVQAWSSAMKQFGLPSKVTGRPTVGGKVAQAVGKTLLPIVKIPTNIVAEAFQYATGAVTGSARLAAAMKRGVDTLKPEEADLIMRELKKGSLGGAVMLLGFLAPQVIGGYYQQGQKRRDSDVKPGGVRLYGANIPPMLLHNPAVEMLQVGATVRRVADSKLRKKDRSAQGIPAGVMAAGLGLIQEVPFVNETTQISKVFNPNERTQFFGELARSRTEPQVMQWLAQQGDKRGANMPEALLPWKGEVRARKPDNFKDEMKMGIPGLRKTVPLKKKQLSYR